MLIGELARSANVSRDTIRHYEELGLLRPGQRRLNNYKEYPAAALSDLQFIQLAKGLGFTLQEIRAVIDVFRNNRAPCAELALVLEEKLALVQRKREELQHLEQRIGEQLQRLRLSAASVQA